jgi:hypothetical protein
MTSPSRIAMGKVAFTRGSSTAAKHMANCAVLGNASYAYVKDTLGGTIFYLKSDQYQEVPIQPKAKQLILMQEDQVRIFAPDQKLPSHIGRALLDAKG